MKMKDPTNGGGGQKGPSETDKATARLQQQLLRKQISAASQMPEMPAIPTAPKIEKIAPPPQQTTADTEAAARELRKSLAKRKGLAFSRKASSGAALGSGSPLGAASVLGKTTF